MLATNETIAAIASAPGGALRGILRVSGPDAIKNATQWFQASSQSDAWQQSFIACVCEGVALLDSGKHLLPGALYVWPDRRSYTRQPTVEFHTLGSPPLLDLLLQSICRCGARLALPGEFTLRAFLAGRLDLTQAEAVLGVIDASSQRELQVALRQLAGGLAQPLLSLRGRLLDLLAHLEAGLDFVEEDIEFISRADLIAQLREASDELSHLQSLVSSRGSSDQELRVVLYGRPNVGKSSLLNALAQDGVAIVSNQAGTTRDYLTTCIELGGRRIQLIDTAGFESSTSGISLSAQDGSARQIAEANLRLLCLDSSRPLDDWELAEVERADPLRLLVATKCDQNTSRVLRSDEVATSAMSGEGIDTLRQVVATRLQSLESSSGDVVAGTAIRCRESLDSAAASLTQALQLTQRGGGEELLAADLRMALDDLGRVAGAVVTDDILDRIFSRFCIGK